MLITIYTSEPLDNLLRKDLEIPVWPYSKDPEDVEDFEKFMQEHKIFRYEDSDYEIDGINVNYSIDTNVWDGEVPEAPFEAFLNEGYVDDDFKPIAWPADKPESANLVALLKTNPITADLMAWNKWNVQCRVTRYTSSMIARTILEEYLDPKLCSQGKCWKPDPVKESK